MTPELQVTIRDGIPSDKPFIMATMLRGLYYGDSWFSQIHQKSYFDNYKLVLEALLNKPNTIVKIACRIDDPDLIVGYSILTDSYDTVHWVYVKQKWRKQGIAKALLPLYPTTVTHLTALGKILLKKFETCIFNPFAL